MKFLQAVPIRRPDSGRARRRQSGHEGPRGVSVIRPEKCEISGRIGRTVLARVTFAFLGAWPSRTALSGTAIACCGETTTEGLPYFRCPLLQGWCHGWNTSPGRQYMSVRIVWRGRVLAAPQPLPICPFHFRTRLKVAKEEGCQTPPTDVRANRIRNRDIQYSKHK